MDILKLTTSKAIRSVLGVSENDMDEDHFKDSEMEDEVKLHLLEWLPAYATIISDQADPSTATEDQKNIFSHLRMYAKYYCADLGSKSSAFMLAQMQSDGENEYQRYQDNKDKKVEKLIDSIHRKMAVHRALLVAYAKTNLSGTAETTTYTQFGTASPDSDPVTGEST